jgi:phage tail-like protein
MKKIQIDSSTLTIALLLIFAGCAAAVAQTRSPVTTTAPSVPNTPVIATATPVATAPSFELVVAGQSSGTFRQMTSPGVPAAAPTKSPITPSRRKPMTLTLSGGDAKGAQYLFDWNQAVIRGNMALARRNATIIAHGANGTELLRYNLTNSFPIKVTNQSLATGASATIVESAEITYESISESK